ncbi:MAG: class I SAM-dependent methyltransferase, partial [Patescibacteria group bacterium]
YETTTRKILVPDIYGNISGVHGKILFRMLSKRKIVHEKYHSNRKLQKRLINKHDFTYFNLLQVAVSYLPEAKRILDIGCGVGTVSYYFGSMGKKVVGIDISKTAIELAKLNAKSLNVDKNVKFKVIDFPDQNATGKFDLVLLSEVLEHLRDDNLAVKKIYRLLRPKGLVIASSPSKNAPLFRAGLLRKFDKEVGHLRRYNEAGFKKLFKDSNFKILETRKTEGIIRNTLFTNVILGKSIRFIRWFLSDFINFVDRLTIPIFGESQVYVVARKI